MVNDLFSLREQEIFRSLTALKGCSFVIIGGYAVNAYTLPRFSVDCDIVIADEDELKNVQNILISIGYRQEHLPPEALYSGSFLRYEKKVGNDLAVSMDILFRDVRDRATGAAFSADWIFEHSKVRILRGKTIPEELRLRIINADALLVMKIISCRPTDIRDIFMMLPHAQDKKWLASEASSRYDLNDRLSRIIEKVDSKQFKDGLAGVYGRFDQDTFDKHKKAILSLGNAARA
ncbi:nucleotidyl transferase AbiEii/AbiGii toxin family protein [Candidatus Woesearchaeota archaeon]|nr:nucleotidyl transferase AbiEii/AbiGii toxin family protein [Candidatus Woesearchaeota archaeon]